MNIAELFVRVTGETSDLTSKMAGAQSSMERFGNSTNKASAASEGHTLSLGRVERALGTYVGRAMGANAVTEQLSIAFSAFAVGTGVVAGVLVGVAAIVAVYNSLTEASKKATEESDKLGQSLLAQGEAQRALSIEGRRKALDGANDRLTAAKGETGAGLFSTLLQGMAPGGQSMNAMTPGDAAAHTRAIADATEEARVATNNLGEAIAHLYNFGTPAATAHATAVKEVTGKYGELADAAAKVNAENTKSTKDFWRNYIDSTQAALTLTEQLAQQIQSEQPSLLEVFKGMVTVPIPKVDISGSVRTAGNNAKEINDAAAKNAAAVRDAVWGAGLQSASMIVSALNLGGGGQGSSLGGAIGSTAGFAGGMMLTMGNPVGGAIGSLIGTMAGSLFGGLFDHPKSQEQIWQQQLDEQKKHTAWLQANNGLLGAIAEAVQFAPSGFKVEPYRYDATRIKALQQGLRVYAARGGARGLG
jgi:hypothetical protein